VPGAAEGGQELALAVVEAFGPGSRRVAWAPPLAPRDERIGALSGGGEDSVYGLVGQLYDTEGFDARWSFRAERPA
jgi:hypothetical protein